MQVAAPGRWRRWRATPPTVPPRGGRPRASRCPAPASVACRSASRQPGLRRRRSGRRRRARPRRPSGRCRATRSHPLRRVRPSRASCRAPRTTTARSCSAATRSTADASVGAARGGDPAGRHAVDRVGRRPPRPRGRPSPPSSCSSDEVDPSEHLRHAGLGQRVRAPVPPGHLAAQARRREDLAGVGDPGRGRTRSAPAASCPGRPSVNIRGMYFALSEPTPCSPVIEPPCSMQRSRIAPRHLLGRARPAPVDGVVEEHQRVQVAVAGVEDVGHPDARVAATSSAIARSTSGSAVRGITPSWTM